MFDRETAKATRRERGIDPRELGASVGVSERTMWRYESGDSEPPFSVAVRIAHALGLKVEQLYIHEPEASTASMATAGDSPVPAEMTEAPALDLADVSRVGEAKAGAR
jgi:DNA-binding XRE family transcriptional regulator